MNQSSKTDRNIPVQEGLRILAKLIARRVAKDLQKNKTNFMATPSSEPPQSSEVTNT